MKKFIENKSIMIYDVVFEMHYAHIIYTFNCYVTSYKLLRLSRSIHIYVYKCTTRKTNGDITGYAIMGLYYFNTINCICTGVDRVFILPLRN